MAVESKTVIKQFRDGSSNFWISNKHYQLNEKGAVVFICGGNSDEKDIELLKAYISRNKKIYKPREQSIFDQEQIEYSKVTFGKYNGKTTNEIALEDKRYAVWLFENTTDSIIKSELKTLLKK